MWRGRGCSRSTLVFPALMQRLFAVHKFFHLPPVHRLVVVGDQSNHSHVICKLHYARVPCGAIICEKRARQGVQDTSLWGAGVECDGGKWDAMDNGLRTVACLSGSPEKDIRSSRAINNICLIMFCNSWTLCMSICTCAKLFFKFALCTQALDNETFLKKPLLRN